MEPKDGNGQGDERPARKKRAPSAQKRAPTARKRAPKAVQAAEQNGVGTAEREVPVQTAYDVKDVHRALAEFSDDDLKQIPIIPEGTHLEQGATYIDLSEEQPTEVKVNAGVIARAGHYFVPKNRVPYTIWNRLIGDAKPGQEVSGAADRSASEVSTAGEAMGDQPAAGREDGGGRDYGNGDADRAAESAADLKSWMDTRREDREDRGEVL